MHSWHIAFQDHFQSFESFSFKEYCFQMPFTPIFFETKRFQKESIPNEFHQLWSYFYSSSSIFENQNIGKLLNLTS
jgi:hypothetical protein